MNAFLARLVALTRKETRQLLRDRSNLAIGIVLPMILIVIFGYGLSMDVKKAPLAIVLADASPTAMQAISPLQLSPVFAPILLGSVHDAEELMRARQVDAIIVVPADFSRRLAAGGARVQLIVQGADAARARTIMGYVGAALARGELHRGIIVQERIWFNAANSSTWYLVPGLIVLVMTLVGAFLTALVMAREWERGTLEALFVTPVRPLEILLAKMIPYFAIGMVGFVLCLAGALLLFGLPMEGSIIVLVVCAMLYLTVAVGMGLLISSVTRNQFLASQVALLSTFMPSLMLSGFLFDLRNVPMLIQLVGKVLPATYFIELIRTLFLVGSVWSIIFKNAAILLCYAIVLVALALRVTRKRLD
jgi:ABC-2 type transport system permease protein